MKHGKCGSSTKKLHNTDIYKNIGVFVGDIVNSISSRGDMVLLKSPICRKWIANEEECGLSEIENAIYYCNKMEGIVMRSSRKCYAVNPWK